ncbi:putative DNA polymerase [Frankliniella fusca]|uniref:DNA polymerase n=1 Tax=Frankliniella fusca TaxID=407009 RepID=A0AAE1H7V2_9NEOP|nr:putative DNA polymerase [Frankliniella fusca]
MALKIQASGWPEGCDSEKAKEDYMADVLKYDGIIIDPTKVTKNPALRQLSKLMLNSFWGKFGEKTLRPKTEFVYNYGELMQMIIDPRKIVQNLLPLSDACLQVTWKPVPDSEESLPTSSLLHAALTTCHGRVQLYRYLDLVGDRAVYCDTDSVAYISRPGEPDLPLGTHLGDLSDQIGEDFGPGSFITEFFAGGPKNYGFKVAVGGDPAKVKVTIKVRGITINKSCDDLVTFDNLKAMVMGETDPLTIPIPRQIARIPGWRVVTRDTSKVWQVKNTKRRRISRGDTVPHGYNKWHMAEQQDHEIPEELDTLFNE